MLPLTSKKRLAQVCNLRRIRVKKTELSGKARSRNPLQNRHRYAESRNEEHCQLHGLAVEALLKFGTQA